MVDRFKFDINIVGNVMYIPKNANRVTLGARFDRYDHTDTDMPLLIILIYLFGSISNRYINWYISYQYQYRVPPPNGLPLSNEWFPSLASDVIFPA